MGAAKGLTSRGETSSLLGKEAVGKGTDWANSVCKNQVRSVELQLHVLPSQAGLARCSGHARFEEACGHSACSPWRTLIRGSNFEDGALPRSLMVSAHKLSDEIFMDIARTSILGRFVTDPANREK